MQLVAPVAALRGALWAVRALRETRKQLPATPLAQVRVPSPPELPPGAGQAVRATLRRWPSTCLEQSFVLQRWLAAGGEHRDVVIGVTAPGEAFGAHAWVDGEPDAFRASVHELTRIASQP